VFYVWYQVAALEGLWSMKVLIWDFDGTLAYRAGGMWTAALQEVLQREVPGRDVAADQLQAHLRSGFPWHRPDQPHTRIKSAEQWWAALVPVFEQAFKGVGLESPQATFMAHKVQGVYADLERWRLFDDSLSTLARLTSQAWTHVVLSNHVPELQQIISHLQLGPHLARVFNSAETGYEKPNPQAFLLVLEVMGDAAAVWMIGDSFDVDIVGAESVGIPGILVRHLHKDARDCCTSLSLVPTIIDGTRAGT